MLSDLDVRKIIYSSDLIDRTFFNEEKSPDEFYKSLKHAKKIYIRYHGKKWNRITFNKIIKFFKDKKAISSGVVAIGHNTKKYKYTQYCIGVICKSKKLGTFEVDIDLYIYWNPDFSPKN